MNTPIWESKADKIYHCEVHRTGDHTGQLTVVNTTNNTIILDSVVTLAYGAMFGPDMDDVATWQDMSLNAIDGVNNGN